LTSMVKSVSTLVEDTADNHTGTQIAAFENGNVVTDVVRISPNLPQQVDMRQVEAKEDEDLNAQVDEEGYEDIYDDDEIGFGDETLSNSQAFNNSI